MGFSPSLIKRIALVVLLAFSGVRLADAHLHVCLDGQEPPVSIHTADGSVHNDSHHHQAEQHNDRDVEPFDAALLKAGANADVFLVVAAYFIAAPDAPVLRIKADPLSVPALKPPQQLRPPLRGPPV